MIRLLFFLLLFYYSQNIYAQNKNIGVNYISIPEANCGSVDELASYIKQNFSTNTDRVHAIYDWIANHISYDVNLMQQVKSNSYKQPPQPVSDVLKTRRAICQGYADLFTALCKSVGINAMTVGGYVKNIGRIAPMAHAWVAAELNGEWFLFDPTWGAGYLDNDRFVKQFNNKFYNQYPKDFISDHMPFDPLYQFLSYPGTNREFINGTAPVEKIAFNYKDSLVHHSQLSSHDQMAAELRRMEGAGIENNLLQERRAYLKISLQSYTANNAFDEGGKNFSKAIVLLNNYFSLKNKQFTTVADNDLLRAVDSMKYHIILARSLLSTAATQTDDQQMAKRNNLANIDQYWKQLNQEEQFVNEYIATDKSRRIQLFMKH